MAPLEPWEKVLIDGEVYPDSVHGQIACEDCHNGVQSPDKDTAHTNLIPNPSQDSQTYCGECHPDIVATEAHSLHSNLAGYWTVLDERSIPADHPAIEEAFANHCDSCHATCGECHVSQPNLVGGGLISGHVFQKTPSMTRNCTACHGSRVGNEYLGKHEDLNADVHFRRGRMTCIDCHQEAEMHGDYGNCEDCHAGPEMATIAPPDHRYDGVQSPRCETCHMNVTVGNDGNLFHENHGGNLQCQVCHSIAYTSCDGCHVSISDTTGNPKFATDSSYLTFLIGKNPRQSYDRPYDYVLVRHIPVDENTFGYYGEGLLDNFSNLPTWAYTTPHNIQLNTPQTETCDACHGNPDIFLTEDKVYPYELEANLELIVDAIPASIFDMTGDAQADTTP